MCLVNPQFRWAVRQFLCSSMKEDKFSLLGLCNATSLEEKLKNCTVLGDIVAPLRAETMHCSLVGVR